MSPWRIFVSKVSVVNLKTPLSDPMAGNVCVYLVAGVGGLKNGAQRNVKPDHHRPCPPTPGEIKK